MVYDLVDWSTQTVHHLWLISASLHMIRLQGVLGRVVVSSIEGTELGYVSNASTLRAVAGGHLRLRARSLEMSGLATVVAGAGLAILTGFEGGQLQLFVGDQIQIHIVLVLGRDRAGWRVRLRLPVMTTTLVTPTE